MTFFIRISDVSAQTNGVPGISEAVAGSSGVRLDVMEIFVSPAGKDKWEDMYPEPTADKTDSPLASIQRTLESISFFIGQPYYASLPTYNKSLGHDFQWMARTGDHLAERRELLY